VRPHSHPFSNRKYLSSRVLGSNDVERPVAVTSPGGTTKSRTYADEVRSIVIADDYEVVRAGLRSFLAMSQFNLVGEAEDGVSALRLIAEHSPDVALLDISMPNMDGFECLGRIKLEFPETCVIMLDSSLHTNVAARAFAMGANGYITRYVNRAELVASINAAVMGITVAALLSTPARTWSTIVRGVEIAFTKRETGVLEQLAAGLTNKEIARILGISYETTKQHVQHILRKLGLKDRTQAAVWAARRLDRAAPALDHQHRAALV
jgi:DNA-binding NarL/FixJ family response regulator